MVTPKKKLTKEEIEQEIEDFRSYLEQEEEKDPFRPDEELRKLSEKIFYFHVWVETYLDELIDYGLYHHVEEKLNEKEEALLVNNLRIVYGEMQFFDKLKIALKLKTISINDFEKLKAFNKLRNNFAHPNYISLRQYTLSKEKLREALEQIFVAFNIAEEKWENLCNGKYWDDIAEQMRQIYKEEEAEELD
ncbi:MAG: hypothetical protein PHQ59_04305 [Candidatus Daviesbacteria bacterium]|nr:hypothetical protein [Candidatus Daviesbacteria bacterium]